jgi:replicative DNA helicase
VSASNDGSTARAGTALTAVSGGRVPPQSLDAERSVLGGVLLDNQAFDDVLEIVKPEDFYREPHRRVFEAMQALASRTEPIDRITVKNELTANGVFAAVGGDDFIDLLDKLVPSASNLAYYAKIVREKAILRRLIEAAHAIAAAGYEQQGAVGEFVDEAERKVFAITEQKAQNAFTAVKDVVHTAFKLIQQLYERQEEITGTPSGFADLDRLTSGFQPGDLVILAARPSMGKTAFCLNIATHVGCRARVNQKKIGVAIFSLEMPKEQLVMRMLASEARVDAQRLRTGKLIESDWSKLAMAAGVLADANIHIDDSPTVSALELRAKCRRLASRYSQSEAPLGLIIVDYLQLMKGNERIDSREQQISEISRALKGLAKELKLPVLALSQLNRSLEKRPDKRPQLSDLRECVTGDTLVVLANGARVPISELVGTTPRVWAMSPAGNLIAAASEKVWKVGRKPVFEVSLACGRRLRCTPQHRLFSSGGWMRLEALRPGDRVALARTLPQPSTTETWPELRIARPLYNVHVSGAHDQRVFLEQVGAFGPRVAPARALEARLETTEANTNVDTLPMEIFDRMRSAMAVAGVSQRRMAVLRGTSYGGTSHYRFAPSRKVVRDYARLLRDDDLAAAAASDLFWDRIVSVEAAGEEEVYDLTVPGPASWLADGIVSHNSGAIEQDADTICFIYREEVYDKEKEDVRGIAEIIVGKQRNGPIGTTTVAFLHEFTRFENLAREYSPSGRGG